LDEPVRTIALACVCFGLRISECLGLKWSDVDWLNSTLRVERSIVRQRVGDVKTIYSGRMMSLDPEMLLVLRSWKQTTQSASEVDWIFASPGSTRSATRFRSLGLADVSRGRYTKWDRKGGNPLASSQLPFVVRCCRNSGCRAAETHAARGHPHYLQHLRGRCHQRDGLGTLEGSSPGPPESVVIWVVGQQDLRIYCGNHTNPLP